MKFDVKAIEIHGGEGGVIGVAAFVNHDNHCRALSIQMQNGSTTTCVMWNWENDGRQALRDIRDALDAAEKELQK